MTLTVTFQFTKVKGSCTNGLSIHIFLLMFNSSIHVYIWPNLLFYKIYCSKSEWPWPQPSKVTKIKFNCTNGLLTYMLIVTYRITLLLYEISCFKIWVTMPLFKVTQCRMWQCLWISHIWIPINVYLVTYGLTQLIYKI